MASPFPVACPHCNVKFKVNDPSVIGKKIRCPKCKEPFAVKGPRKKAPQKKAAPVEDDFSALDDFGEDDFGDDFGDDLPPQPTRRKASSTKSKGKKRRKSSSGGGGKVVLIIGLVLLGMVVVSGLGFGVYLLATSLMGGGRFAYLPDDCQVIVEIQVDDIWNSAAVSPLKDQADLPAALQKADIDPGDIDRMIIGAKDAQGMTLGRGTGIAVIHLNKGVDITTIDEMTSTSEELDHNGTKYYKDRGGQAVFQPSSSVIVTGDEASVLKAIDSGGKSNAGANFTLLPSGHDVVFAMRNLDSQNSGQAIGPMAAAQETLEKVKAVAFTADFGSDIDLSVTMECASESDSKEAADGLKEFKGQAKMGVGMMAAMSGGEVDADELTALIDGISIESSGTNVSMEVTIPGKLIEAGAKAQKSGPSGPPPGFSPGGYDSGGTGAFPEP